MEKRVLLAIILSFLVLVLWSYIFPPHSPLPQREPKESDTPQVLQKPVSKGEIEIEQKKDSATPSIAVSHKDIPVETPLYHMLLSTDGPSIKEFRLLNYYTDINKTEQVDIVKHFQHSSEHIRWLLKGLKENNLNVETSVDRIKIEKDDQEKELKLTYFQNQTPVVTYLFKFSPDSYKIDVTSEILTNKNEEITSYLKIAGEKSQKKNYGTHSGFAISKDGKLTEIEFEKKKSSENIKGKINYLALESTYFVSALLLNADIDSELTLSQTEGELISQVRLFEGAQESGKVSRNYSLYIGPKDLTELKKAGTDLSSLVNFGWTDFIAKPLLYGMKFCNEYVKNYGVSIIILTIFVKIIFWPLSNKSYKSMKEMQKIQPLLLKIREKYKDNKEQMNKELMQLYRTYKINPMSGCLPMLVQIPVFFALYKVLSASIELRHSPFVLWVKDLSAPDRLFDFSFSIPFMDPPYGIPVLTLLMGASMFIQQKMSPPAGDPTQAKVMLLLPLIFTFMFINFPSGLVLYWFVNNILSIGQQYYIQKKLS